MCTQIKLTYKLNAIVAYYNNTPVSLGNALLHKTATTIPTFTWQDYEKPKINENVESSK